MTLRCNGPALVLTALWLLAISLSGVGLPASLLAAGPDPIAALVHGNRCGQSDEPDQAPVLASHACDACCLLPVAGMPPADGVPGPRWLLQARDASATTHPHPRQPTRWFPPARGPPDRS